ncbi:isocitrate lyase/phosphoenolpyruvate mutase family protein [Serinibacter arcticus]|uniref:Isocitrate lyase/phosphoenolpyruvate mutase family protein n=1 Tax=Serinibacter arcticus TaxID=1655435 RepID=A0A2U1ZWN0_9MICO|nr:isocitrate lyase/phosphoenolpyruvate mutase family protein [Serinibacter arcticus]PWD51374.1 isocitrate lyase/phosphoenolpyruvate mutase family protein [Serinibacter arcticus]
MTLNAKAHVLRDLHTAPELLQVVNVWDVVSARAIADLPGTRALATAGHSIAATFGYDDGEIPFDLTLDLLGRITAAVDLPVTADLDDGYVEPGETTRRVIGAGVVGANVEDRLRPLAESVARVEAIIAAGAAEGVDFVLNARTDAFVRGGDRPVEESLADAVARGRAYVAAGATTVFVPGNFGEDVVAQLVDGIGERKVSLIGFPAIPAPARLAELGVARLSYGPLTQRVALGALVDLAESVYSGAVPPEGIRPLN